MNNMQNDKMQKHPNTTRDNKPIPYNKNLRIMNNLSSNNSTQNNFFQMKKLKIKKNDKNQKINLELVKKNIFIKFKNNLKKYDSSMRKVNIKTINDIIYDERKHIVTVFKDYLFWDENSDFLKRFYKINESRDRLPRISAYYQTYTLIKPIYFKLECYKLLSKNLKRHKKRLEILEEKISNNKKQEKNKEESFKSSKKEYYEFSKIVKSHYIQTENLIENNIEDANNKNKNKINQGKDLFKDIENKNLNNYLVEDGKGENDFLFYGDNKEKDKNANGINFNNIGIRKMIKLKDAGNKYDIQKFVLEEEKNSNNKSNIKNDFISTNKLNNNSFSFIELHNLIDFNKNTNDLIQNAISKNNINAKNKINSIREKVSDKNSDNLKINNYPNKKLSHNINPFTVNNNQKLNKANDKYKPDLKIQSNSNKFNHAYLKNQDFQDIQHSLFLDDYSIIQSEDKEIKNKSISHNFINLPVNEETSFFTVNNNHSVLSKNNDDEIRSDITMESNVDTKRSQSGKENVFKLNGKEKGISSKLITNNINNNLINNNVKQPQVKVTKKISIPALNLQNINLLNNQNIASSKQDKKQSDAKIIKNQHALETRKFSETIKKDSKIINNKNNNYNSSKEYNKQKSEPPKELKQSNKDINKRNKLKNDNNNNINELSNSKSEKEIETKTNQNFKIIENMIKSIKMNNIDGLIDIINSKSKNKNKAFTSREKDRGDILILQNIYSRNLNKNKLNIDKFARSNTNEKKTLSDKYKSNNIETSKINEFNDKRNIYNNILGKFKKTEMQTSEEIEAEETEENKLEKYTATEPNVTEIDGKANNKKIVIKNSNENKANNINLISSRNNKDINNKKKEIIQNKDVMTDLNIKNNLTANRNLISSAGIRNDNIKFNNNNKIQVSSSSKHNNNNTNYNSNQINPSSIYNINLNLNLNLNLKMNKYKNSEIIENSNSNIKNAKNLNNPNFNSKNNSATNNININNYNQNNISSRKILNKEINNLTKKGSEEDIYKNILDTKVHQDLVVFEPSSLTDRYKKDYFNIEDLKLKSNFKENENIYVNTEDNAKNFQKQIEKIKFINKFSSKIPEKNTNLGINNNLANSNNFQSKFNIPNNLSRNVYNPNNLKLKLKVEEEGNIPGNYINLNQKNPMSNCLNSNYNKNPNSNLTNKIIEEEKKSRNIQNNNLAANANLLIDKNLNNVNNLNCNSNNSNSNSDKYKNTLVSKLRITQPLTQRIITNTVNKNLNNNLNDNLQSESIKHLNLEKKIMYKSEKNRITNPLINANDNKQYNSNNISNNNKKNLIGKINIKLPSANGTRNNSNKISLNNPTKNVNQYYISEKGNYLKNLSERENINKLNTNSNFFSSIDVNNSSSHLASKRDNNKQNYESINSNNNNFNDASLKSPNLINDESYLRIIHNTEKKFNSISRNFNIKNLILFNDTTNINKNSNPISLKQTDSYAKHNINSDTARNNSASNNFYFENYLSNNINEHSGLLINSNKTNNNNDLLINNSRLNKQNYISVEKSKSNNFNSRNINNNELQEKKQNIALHHKPMINNYNDKCSPFNNESSQGRNKKIDHFNNSNNNNNNNNEFIKKKDNKNESENYSLLRNLNEINLFASGDFGKKLKNDANNLINNIDINYKKNQNTDNINNVEKNKIKIPTLNLKDLNKNENKESNRSELKTDLISARNNKNTINDFLKKNINIALNAKQFLTSRNEKNKSNKQNDLINTDLNPDKVLGNKDIFNPSVLSVDNKNVYLKNNLNLVFDSKNKSNTNSNRNLINKFNLKK